MSIPIVSLDKVYLNSNEVIYLDCTRLDGSNSLVSRINPNDNNSVINQIKSISNKLNSMNQKEIILVDDVVFSGNVLNSIIQLFKLYNIKVIGIKGIISSEYAYKYFNNILPYGLVCSYLMSDKVIDQICERDFYFGIAQSGISINKDNTITYQYEINERETILRFIDVYDNKFAFNKDEINNKSGVVSLVRKKNDI